MIHRQLRPSESNCCGVERIIAWTTAQGVGAGTAREDVIAGPAFQNIADMIAGDLVVVRSADRVLDDGCSVGYGEYVPVSDRTFVPGLKVDRHRLRCARTVPKS
jgi:hypothetical protein